MTTLAIIAGVGALSILAAIHKQLTEVVLELTRIRHRLEHPFEAVIPPVPERKP